ncbi:MAG: hypothetical protein HON90_14710 [Halobacteriovoraceae bacterium]|jgi:hypothetical protein|nr:hypothetical protein [Halobacteriovoraceae bacterium]
MATQSNKEKISNILWENSQVNSVSFDQHDYTPTNRGHGLFVKTEGNDTLIDLRLSSHKPFWGHTHPLITQHNYQELKFESIDHNYSVPKTEFIRIIETFQKVNLLDVLKPDFKITYYNVVIFIDESSLEVSKKEANETLSNLLKNNPDTYFWLVEKDVVLLNERDLFFFKPLMNKDRVHLCLDVHFIPSIFIYSHHLFSEDPTIQLFLGIKNLVENILSTNVDGKNKKDFEIIDTYFQKEIAENVLFRKGRYLFINKILSNEVLNKNGIIFTENLYAKSTILAIPTSCTEVELRDALVRIKKSL